MHISKELQEAIHKTQKKFPRIYFDPVLVCQFIGSVAEFYKNSDKRLPTQERLKQARLDALKYLKIWDERLRTAYKSLAGVYFGKKGGIKSGKVRRTKIATKKLEEKEVARNEMMENAKAHEAFHKVRSQD